MRGVRDSQRAKVYRWESTIYPLRGSAEPQGPAQLSLLDEPATAREGGVARYKGDIGSAWHELRTLEWCQEFVTRILTRERTPLVHVRFGRRNYFHLGGLYSGRMILLRKDDASLPMCIHEAAHAVTAQRFRQGIFDAEGIASHGPEYVAVYIELLVKYSDGRLGLGRADLRASARAAHVRVGSARPRKKVSR
jgi:hypothetical protein